MKRSVFPLKVIGVFCATMLVVGLAARSGAEPIVGDGGRFGVLADDGLRFGTAALPTAGNTFEAAKAKSKKYRKRKTKFKKSKNPKAPKVPKAPKATKQKKSKKSKKKKKKKK